MKRIDVAQEFYHRLANRNERQGDGSYTAIDFRTRFLQHLDSEDTWKLQRPEDRVALDFSGVKKIGPSFANEAFGYFMKYCTPESFLKMVTIENASNVQLAIVQEELESAAKGR
jgi:hypothetical protein